MRRDRDSVLDQAVRALRQAGGPEALSDDARAAILRQSTAPAPASAIRGPLAVLFPSSWRMVLAGALPLALALTVAGLASRSRHAVVPEPAEVVVLKSGGRVIFEVPKGATVTKSTLPFAYEIGSEVRVANGRYADRIQGGPSLVFYRIE